MTDFADLESRFGAGNYAPLPVTIVRGAGVYLWDQAGRRYIDMMGAYSAASFGHCHPRLVKALTEQAQRLDTISRAYFSDRLGPFLAKACALTGMDAALPMNSGAEAVETALKAARKWAYKFKGVPTDRANIIVAGEISTAVRSRSSAFLPWPNIATASGRFRPASRACRSVTHRRSPRPLPLTLRPFWSNSR
jgi:acetylornithine/succinyldiaminopimelate/putrescine aminotransferase